MRRTLVDSWVRQHDVVVPLPHGVQASVKRHRRRRPRKRRGKGRGTAAWPSASAHRRRPSPQQGWS